MALEFMCGLDHLGNSTNAGRKWDSVLTIDGFTTGRFSGQALILWGTGANIHKTLTNQATRTVGFALKFNSGSATANPLLLFRDGSSTQVDLRCAQAAGSVLTVTRAGTTLGSSTATLDPGTWYYIEIEATIGSGTSGSVIVHLDGVEVINLSGVNTQATANAYSNQIRLQGGDQQTFYDDVYILNPSGSAPTNTFLGECRIVTELPTGDGFNLSWTPNSGTTHYTQVDESSPDDDSTYVASSTIGAIDTYTFPAHTLPGAILGVQTVLTSRKDDAGVREIKVESRSGGVNYAGPTTHTLTSSYLMYRELAELNPATSAAWTAAAVNATELGVKLQG